LDWAREIETQFAAQLRDHEKNVQLLENEIQSGQEGAMKDFAEKTLPVVEQHLAMAKQLQAKLPKAGAEPSSQ
jgi:putative membrane protein